MDKNKEAPPAVDSYVTTLVISAVGILVTVLILSSFFFIFWWHYLRSHHQPSNATRSHVKSGVQEEILSKIPLVTYSSLENEGQSECSICLGELKDGEVLRVLPACGHAFHVPCIDEWFKEHTNCPFCRSPITCDYCESQEQTDSSENGDQQRVLHDVPGDHHRHELMHDDDGVSASDSSNSNSRFQRPHHVLYRHSHSVSLCHMKKKPRSLGMRLKRSFSMDQSYLYFAVTIQRDQEEASTSSSSKGVTMMSRYKSRSLRHLDHMSRVLMRSFSQFRNSGIGRSNGILPN